MLVELVFSVCLIGEPARCKVVQIEMPDSTILECVTRAQPAIADWLDENPAWELFVEPGRSPMRCHENHETPI